MLERRNDGGGVICITCHSIRVFSTCLDLIIHTYVCISALMEEVIFKLRSWKSTYNFLDYILILSGFFVSWRTFTYFLILFIMDRNGCFSCPTKKKWNRYGQELHLKWADDNPYSIMHLLPHSKCHIGGKEEQLLLINNNSMVKITPSLPAKYFLFQLNWVALYWTIRSNNWQVRNSWPIPNLINSSSSSDLFFLWN